MNGKKLILLILDGWGYREDPSHNAVKLSCPGNYEKLLENDPWILLDASEENVGLPKGQMGNSEVGHMNIGAGRIVYQDLLRISADMEKDCLRNNEAAEKLFRRVRSSSGRLHIMGLVSDGGVHSHIDHIKKAALAAGEAGIKEVYVHVFTDGRDTPPTSGRKYVADLDKWLKENDAGVISDIMGRYYAMDRDKRWDRVETAWKVLRKGEAFRSASDALSAMETAEETDEFLKPVKIDGTDGTVKDGDGVFMLNFRADRARQLLRALTDENFDGFPRGPKPDVFVLTLTEYEKNNGVPCAYPPVELKNILGEVIGRSGLRQLRIAETEKYAHVTYFFNGGREEPFENERRELVASPRDVATYDLKPSMSVCEVERKFEEIFRKGETDFVVMNFANPDMVGHTGSESAAVEACAAVDECLGKVIKTADDTGAVLIVTADHGNAEYMWDYENDQPHTAHTLNPVTFVVHNGNVALKKCRGKLADIAPTVLHLLGLKCPEDMTGENLIDSN